MLTLYTLSPFKPELKGLVRDIRVAWVLEELGLSYERKVMNPLKGEHKKPEYLALNPFGKVPTIKDGDFILYESGAICNYLAEKKGELIPKAGSKERVLYDQWFCFAISTLEPMAMRVFGFDFFIEKDESRQKLREEALGSVDKLLGVVDHELTKRTYLVGNTFSVADALVSSVCRAVLHTGVLEKHPHLNEYLKRNFSRPAFEKALRDQKTNDA